MTQASAALRLKRGRAKAVRNRHPWIFGGAISAVRGDPEPGAIVDVYDDSRQFLARGYYNPDSQIAVRLLTWDENETIDEGFWRQRLAAAAARRRHLQTDDNSACRLAFGESDGLPGLIIDQYNDHLVLQALTLGIDQRKGMLAELANELWRPIGVYERSDADVRAHEGLAPCTGALLGRVPNGPLTITENGLRFAVDLVAGHKTGFYLDQRENRRRVTEYCHEREVLNAFSYTGGFTVYALAHGARHVTNLDASQEALELGQQNLTLNGLESSRVDDVQGDAFHELRKFRDQARQFDLIILDPPKFAFARSQVQAATRGYKDINLLAMRLLRPGGILCTFSCSGLVDTSLFQKVLFGASVDADREVRIIERLSQGADHPTLLTFPEGAYLKGFICQVE